MGLQFAAARALGATWNHSFMTQFYTDGEGAQTANCYGHISRVNLTDRQAILYEISVVFVDRNYFREYRFEGPIGDWPLSKDSGGNPYWQGPLHWDSSITHLHGHIGTSPELYALCLFSCILVACAFDLRISEALRFTDRYRIREHLRVGRAP
jgi:hypothetical protein